MESARQKLTPEIIAAVTAVPTARFAGHFRWRAEPSGFLRSRPLKVKQRKTRGR